MSLTFFNKFKGYQCDNTYKIGSKIIERATHIYDNNQNHTGHENYGSYFFSQLEPFDITDFSCSNGPSFLNPDNWNATYLNQYVGSYLTSGAGAYGNTVYSYTSGLKHPYINTESEYYSVYPSDYTQIFSVSIYDGTSYEGYSTPTYAELLNIAFQNKRTIRKSISTQQWTVSIDTYVTFTDGTEFYVCHTKIRGTGNANESLGNTLCTVEFSVSLMNYPLAQYRRDAKYNYINENFAYVSPIQYQWHSLTSLTSNVNGVQRTQGILGIRTDAIGDVDIQNTAGSLSNLLNPSGDNFNLSTTVRDMTVNATKEIYCGVGKCVITKTTATTATLEFYQANANTAFYTYNFSIANPLTSHDYIGFYIDTTNYKGYFNIISENLSTHVLTYNGISQTLENRNQFYTWLTAQPVTNPYSNNEVTTPQGGTNFAPRKTEKVVANTFPTKTGLASGLFSIYVMTESDLQDFASELWDTNWVDNLDKKYTMPTDLFAGLFMLPFKARGNFYPNDAYQYPIKAGGVDFTAKGYTVTNRYVTFDMGCIDLKPQWDTYFDYKYSKCMIYLPFIGEYELSMSDLLTKIENDENDIAKIVDTSNRIKLEYKLDVFTGILVAQIIINGSIVYEFSGSCASELPLTWNTRQAAVDATVNGIIGGVLLVGGVAAGLATAGVATTAAGAIAGVAGAFGAGVTGTQAVTKSVLNENKQEIHSTGKMGGLVGALGVNYPYITITTPNVVMSKDQLQMKGLPSFTKAKIKGYASDNDMIWPNSGYLNVAYIELNGYFGTEEEQEELVNLLKGGVII